MRVRFVEQFFSSRDTKQLKVRYFVSFIDVYYVGRYMEIFLFLNDVILHLQILPF